MNSINDKLNTILEDKYALGTPAPNNPWAKVNSLSIDIESKKQELYELEQQRAEATQEYINELARKLRQSSPNMNIMPDRNGCSVEYRSKSLMFNPDFNMKVWVISGPDQSLVDQFGSLHSSAMPLHWNLSPISQAILNFFQSHYRTLR